MSITLEQLKDLLPINLKRSASQTLVDTINNLGTDPTVKDEIEKNFIHYTGVLQDGKYKLEDYLSAVIYVTHKLYGSTNQDAYFKTFPKRHQALLLKGATPKDISAYVSAYNSNKLVNAILEQSLVPTWVLNAHIYQEAINTQAELMKGAESEFVRMQAANSILTHLAKPKEAGPLINIDFRQNTGIKEMEELLVELATKQQELIKQGAKTQDIIDVSVKAIRGGKQ